MILALLIELMPQVLPFIFALFVGYLIYNDVQVTKFLTNAALVHVLQHERLAL